MKLKMQPADFQVTELADISTIGGDYALYRLNKTSLGTPEAISAILKKWNLPRDRISYGGMKDRHASTSQYITIFRGPTRDFTDRSFQLTYLGQTERRFTAKEILGNRFQIRLRSIRDEEVEPLEKRLATLMGFGLVNYFDDQRFGSLGHSGRFIAEPWCKGDYESALYLALAEPNRHDRRREAEQKAALREHWGDWKACKRLLDRSHRRSIVSYLVDHPSDFKRAMSLVRSDLRSIYVAAFQSALWNRWLSRIIQRRCQPGVGSFKSASGTLYLPLLDNLESCCPELLSSLDWLRNLHLPLPSARQRDWPEEFAQDLDEILAEFGLQRRELRLKYPRDTFFSRGSRSCWLRIDRFKYDWNPDSLHPGRRTLSLHFELPRGAYATMLVKMLRE